MRRLLGLIALLAPALGHAQPGATEPVAPGSAPSPDVVAPPRTEVVAPPSEAPLLMQTDPALLSLARGVRAAAVRGDCIGARALGSRIARLDPEFHRTVIRTDPAITQCRQAALTRPVAEREEPAGVYQRRAGTPPIDGGRIFGELIVGGLFTIGGAFGGAFLGIAIAGDCNDDDCITSGIVGAFLGGTVLAAVGVNFVGDTDDVEGSLGVTIAGSMVASLLSIGLAMKADDEDSSVLILLAAPTVGAIAGFNLSRKYKDVRVSVRPAPMAMGNGGIGLSLASGSF